MNEQHINIFFSKNKKLSLELRGYQLSVDEHLENAKIIRETNDRLKTQLTQVQSATAENRSNELDVAMQQVKHLEMLLQQKTLEHHRTSEALRAKHLDIEKVRRAASEDRRRFLNENIQLNSLVN